MDRLFDEASRGTVVFMGLLCIIVFAVNAGLLIWLAMKRGNTELARCPKCGRTIICPHCSEDGDTPA